jgi:hypothetical protein
MIRFRLLGRALAAAFGMVLASCTPHVMTSGDFAVADAAARSTGKLVRVDDGRESRPLYRSLDGKIFSQVTFATPRHAEAGFGSYVDGFTKGVALRGGRMIRRTHWRHRGIEITEQLHDFGADAKLGLRYGQVLFARLPAKVVVVESMGIMSDPSAVKGNELMKALVDSRVGS